MCQTMGLHRNATSSIDSSPLADSKRHAFWSLYTIDKNISLNIGVTSHFQDHDIDTELYTPSQDHKQRSWDLINLITVEFAAIQGRVYDQLYSIGASRAPEEERLSRIHTLSMDLLSVRNKLLEVHPPHPSPTPSRFSTNKSRSTSARASTQTPSTE
jgi:hypothetical protein